MKNTRRFRTWNSGGGLVRRTRRVVVAAVLFWQLGAVAAAAADIATTSHLRRGASAVASSRTTPRAHSRSLQASSGTNTNTNTSTSGTSSTGRSTSRGIPGTTQTVNGYDTEMGTDAICWYSTGRSAASAAAAQGEEEEDDDSATATSTSVIALPNPLVADYTLDERVHLLQTCPMGNSLQAHAPISHTVQGERLRTLQWYNYTITVSLNITSLLQQQQVIAETAAKEAAAAYLRPTADAAGTSSSSSSIVSTTGTTAGPVETGGSETTTTTTIFLSSEAHQAAQEAQTMSDLVEAAAAIGFVSDSIEESSSSPSSSSSFVAFQVVNCVVGVSGFCSPFIHEEANHRLYQNALLRGEKEAPLPPARGNLHGETHVHSPYIKIALPPHEGPVYTFNVTVPMLINHANSFFSIAAVQLFLPDPTVHDENSSSNVTTRLVRYDMANALFGTERLLSYQEPAIILTVPIGIAICSYICVAGTALIIAFLLQQTIQHRNHQILQLSQASFLIAFQMAALIATCTSILFQPNNDVMCAWSRPILLSTLQFMYAITVGRLWRIHTVISPLLLQTYQKRQTSRRKLAARGSHSSSSNSNSSLLTALPPSLSRFSWMCSFCCCCCFCCTADATTAALEGLMNFLERVSTATSSLIWLCSNVGVGGCKNGGGDRGRNSAKNLRRQVTSAQLAVVVSIFTVPQVILQILAATLQPQQYQIDFNDDESIGRAICSSGSDLDLASTIGMYGYYLFLFLIMLLLFMAHATRQLPSLFNETKYIFDSTMFTLVLLAVGVSIILVTNSPTTSPGVQYLVLVSIVLSMTLNATLRIVWPKLAMIWRGETVVVSKLVFDHAEQTRSRLGRGSSLENSSVDQYMNKTRISGLYPPPVTTGSTAMTPSTQGSSTVAHRGGDAGSHGAGSGGAVANNGASNTNYRFHSSFGHSETIMEEMERFRNDSIGSKRSLVGSDCDSCNTAGAKAAAPGTTLANDGEVAKRLHEIMAFENDDSERKDLIAEEKIVHSQPELTDQETATASTKSSSSSGPNLPLPSPRASVSFADGTKTTALNAGASHHPHHHHQGANHPRTVVRQNETPARRLVLKMMDLEDCLSSVNERIMSGMAVPPEEWETLRRVAGKMGDVFMNDVQFEWEQDEDTRNDNNTAATTSSHDNGGDVPRNTPATKAAAPVAGTTAKEEDGEGSLISV